MWAVTTMRTVKNATSIAAADAVMVHASAEAVEELVELVQTALSALEPDALRTLAFEEVSRQAEIVQAAIDRVGRVLDLHMQCGPEDGLEHRAAALAEMGAYIVRTVGYPVRCGVRYDPRWCFFSLCCGAY
jgi:hypothetical protein